MKRAFFAFVIALNMAETLVDGTNQKQINAVRTGNYFGLTANKPTLTAINGKRPMATRLPDSGVAPICFFTGNNVRGAG